MSYKDNISTIASTNDRDYNWKKLSEELFELGEVCMKMVNKKQDNRPRMERFIEEAGDVIIRIDVIASIEEIVEPIASRKLEKTKKLVGYIDKGLYKGGV